MSFHNRQYEIVGRRRPTEAHPEPPMYRMRIFAVDEVKARSRFHFFVRKLKMKRTQCEILNIKELKEKKPLNVKNYGMWLRYQSRSGIHNIYKEYRDTTVNAAVDQMYDEMASRHRARRSCVQIMRTAHST
eukprot:GABW01001691.1.p1 GENE.GABW01001691.1~~GABW01001691.1.p1  ORF type:complete len:131 (-),score=45.83 GABW01001691.1:3-395(-)